MPGFAHARLRMVSAISMDSERSPRRNFSRGGRRIEEILRLGPSTPLQCCRSHGSGTACVDLDPPCGFGASCPARQGESADSGNRGQGLPAKSHRADVEEIVCRQLRGRVALHGERQLFLRDAGAVIDHANQALSALLDLDLDMPRTCVECVFHQFLDRGGGPLHDFTRGNPVDGVGVQPANAGARWRAFGHATIIYSMGPMLNRRSSRRVAARLRWFVPWCAAQGSARRYSRRRGYPVLRSRRLPEFPGPASG